MSLSSHRQRLQAQQHRPLSHGRADGPWPGLSQALHSCTGMLRVEQYPLRVQHRPLLVQQCPQHRLASQTANCAASPAKPTASPAKPTASPAALGSTDALLQFQQVPAVLASGAVWAARRRQPLAAEVMLRRLPQALPVHARGDVLAVHVSIWAARRLPPMKPYADAAAMSAAPTSEQ